MNEDTTFVIPDHPYFTLPLAALPALRESREIPILAEHLICLAVVRQASEFSKKYPEESMNDLEDPGTNETLEDWRDEHQVTEGNTPIALACWFLGVIPYDLDAMQKKASLANIANKPSGYSTKTLFSVQSRDLFDLKDGDIPLQDFLVLAAIRSILGTKPKSKPPWRITRDQIAARIGGYSSPKDIHPNRRKMLLNEPNLKRIGRTAIKLARQERFTRWTGFKRETYYHVCKSESEIADYVTKIKLKTVNKKIAGLEAELESKTKLQEARDKEKSLREALSKFE